MFQPYPPEEDVELLRKQPDAYSHAQKVVNAHNTAMLKEGHNEQQRRSFKVVSGISAVSAIESALK